MYVMFNPLDFPGQKNIQEFGRESGNATGHLIFQDVVSTDSRLLYGDSERLYFLR